MDYWLKMNSGPMKVSGSQIETLRTQGKLPNDKRLISIDGGDTWLDYSEVMTSVELIKKASSKSVLMQPPPLPPLHNTIGLPEIDAGLSISNESFARSRIQIISPAVFLILGLGFMAFVLSGSMDTSRHSWHVGGLYYLFMISIAVSLIWNLTKPMAILKNGKLQLNIALVRRPSVLLKDLESVSIEEKRILFQVSGGKKIKANRNMFTADSWNAFRQFAEEQSRIV